MNPQHPTWQTNNAAGVPTYKYQTPLNQFYITQQQQAAIQATGAFYSDPNRVWPDTNAYTVKPTDYVQYTTSDTEKPVYVAWKPPTTLSNPARAQERTY